MDFFKRERLHVSGESLGLRKICYYTSLIFIDSVDFDWSRAGHADHITL